MELSGKRVLVVGLGKSGLAAARFLKERGARVTVSDARPATLIAELPGLLEPGLPKELEPPVGLDPKELVPPGLVPPVVEPAPEFGWPLVAL